MDKNKLIHKFTSSVLVEKQRKNKISNSQITTTMVLSAINLAFVNESCKSSDAPKKSQRICEKLQCVSKEDIQKCFQKNTLKNLNFLKLMSRNRKFVVSFDTTKEAFYGDFSKAKEPLYLHSGSISKESYFYYEYLTVAITGNTQHKYILDGMIVHRGFQTHIWVSKMIKQIKKQLSLEVILFDRGFGSKELIFELQKLKVPCFFQELIDKAVEMTMFHKGNNLGRPEILTLKQRVKILLIQKFVNKSNREMSEMLMLFSCLQDIDISYKTVERLYDDERIRLILLNMNSLIKQKLNITNSNASGDGTGFMLSIKEHYASIAQKLKDKGKINTKKRKTFYSFTLIDVDKRIYLAYGTSYRSEKEAYNKAINMLTKSDVNLTSIRLDRYYSDQTSVKNLNELFKGIKCYLIPKKRTKIRGSNAWFEMLSAFYNNYQNYFAEYFKKNQSESGFSEDKRRFVWRISQKIESRIDMAYFSIFTWHNYYG